MKLKVGGVTNKIFDSRRWRSQNMRAVSLCRELLFSQNFTITISRPFS
jgi:hypothetical protein